MQTDKQWVWCLRDLIGSKSRRAFFSHKRLELEMLKEAQILYNSS